MNKKLMTCEIGCGEKKMYENSICLDFRKTVQANIVSDARQLPFKNSCFDHVYSSHAIEHFSHVETKKVLQEWIRVLNKDGIFELRCPDLRARALFFAIKPSWMDVINIYGEQEYVHNYHKCGFSYNLVKNLLTELGITNIKRIINGYKGIPLIPDSLHVRVIKK